MEQIYTEGEEEGNKWDEGGEQQATTRDTRNSRGSNGRAKRDLSSNNIQEAAYYMKELKVLFSNVDMFTNYKINELRVRISGYQSPPQVIAIQEVKPKHYRFERDILEYCIEGYEIFGKNLAKEEHGRGLSLYIQKGIQHDVVVFKEEATEYIATKIKGKSDDVLFVSIYRSPNSDTVNNEKTYGYAGGNK